MAANVARGATTVEVEVITTNEERARPLGVRLRPELREWLAEEAARTGVPVNRLINDALARHKRWRDGMNRRDAKK